MNSSTLDNYTVFEDEVKSNFYFLQQQYGFRLNQIKQVGYAKVIRFESPSIYVNLFYGPPADQGDLVLLKNCANWKWNPADPNHLVGLISEFARC